MPWQPLPRIAFAVTTYPFTTSAPHELPLQLGDELYLIEQGGRDGEWFRGYLVAPPSLLAGLTSEKGETLPTRIFEGIFPRSCVEVKEVLGDDEEDDDLVAGDEDEEGEGEKATGMGVMNGHTESEELSLITDESPLNSPRSVVYRKRVSSKPSKSSRGSTTKIKKKRNTNRDTQMLAVVTPRDPDAPKPPAPVPLLKVGDETAFSASEPLVDEIASCLREWHSTKLHELLLSRQYSLLEDMSTLVQTLDFSRRQILHNVLTNHELSKLREKTVWDLVKGNKVFGGEVIVRDPAAKGRVLTGEDSVVEMTKLQSMMSLLEERPQPVANEKLTLHHLLVDMKTFVGSSTEATSLVFYLVLKAPGHSAVPLSESYIVEVPPSGTLSGLLKSGNMKTLFTDLAAADIGDLSSPDTELYLVVKVRSTQQVIGGKPGSKGAPPSRDGGLRNGEHSSTSLGSSGKGGRRSLMWGKQGSQRNAHSRNAPISSKLNSLTEEQADARNYSRDGPPKTADSMSGAGERNSTSVSRTVRKTVGIGAIKINAIMKVEEEVEQVITIWSPSSNFQDKQDHIEGWEDVIKDLMPSSSGGFDKSRRAERVQVQLRPFSNPDADMLVKATPTLLSGVSRTNKMGFSGAPTKARSDIYITIDEAFLSRHALLSRATGSATPLSNSVAGSNLQINLEVRRASGERLENCIYASSNAEASSTWESTATDRGDAWNQNLRLSIPPTEVPTCHLMVTLSDAPNGPFAICHMPLWDQQAFMRDGHHSLLLYRYDESTNTPRGRGEGKTGYLTVPWNARGKDDVSKDEAVTGPIATLRVQTYLCSTRFSQDKVLLGLLKWKEQAPGDIQGLLQRLVFVPEIEIVKLLNDVFDAIFSLLVEHAGDDDYEDLIFSALVTVLGIVHDRRFNLGPLVDQYAENKFNYPFATPCLVRSFTRLLSNPSDPATSRKLRATFKVVRHILKFITHARGQQKAKEAGIGITSTSPGFTRHLRSIFKSLDGLMRNSAPINVGSQTLAVQHFHTWLPELTGLLSTEEILHIAIDFMDSCAEVKGKLILYKLVLIINYSKLELFSQAEQRAALSANTVRWIAPHWGKTSDVIEQWSDQVRLCCTILSTQVDTLGPEIPDYIPKIIDSYLALSTAPKTEKTRLSLLFPTTYPFPTKAIQGKAKFDEVLVELSAILSAVSTRPAGMQLELAEDEMATLLEDTLKVHLSILQCEAFPADWLSVHIYHHKSTMKTLQYLASILLDSFLPDPDEAEGYNTELWKAFFTVLLKLIGSDALAVETFPEQKRRVVWKIADDVRLHGAQLLNRTWEAIGWETSPDERQNYGLAKMGGYQVQYVPALVGPIVELCLSPHEGLRGVAVEVLQTMIVSEWTLSEDLSTIQTEMINSLDHLFKSKPMTESILQKLFIHELLGLFEFAGQASEDPLFEAVKEVIATIDEFLDLLVAVHSSSVTGEASHLVHRLRLLEFLRDMQNNEIFIRNTHELVDWHTESRHLTQAALSLKAHADLYAWDTEKSVPAMTRPEFPQQSEFERKERLYFEMIRLFEEGEAWSNALAIYQELQQQYTATTFDFAKLARTQRSIATIYETILKNDKPPLKYFKLTYHGMGFPRDIRDKEFIFQGLPGERTAAFTDRMQEIYRVAHILQNGDVDEVEGQFLKISPVSPHRDLEAPCFYQPRVPQVVRDYLVSSHPQEFSVTIKRHTQGPASEHYAEKIVYRTLAPFPTITRSCEVEEVQRIRLSPLQTAVERVLRKTTEIATVEKRLAEGEQDMAVLLLEAIQISTNPESDNSVLRYRELVPMVANEEGELERAENLEPLEKVLSVALIDHAILIKRCIAVLAKHSSLSHQLNSTNIVNHSQPDNYISETVLVRATSDFEESFAQELSSYAFPQIQRSPTPTPSWQIASPVISVGSREQRLSTMLANGANRRSSPQLETNGTSSSTANGILDTPAARAGRNRLSFLHRHTREPSTKEQEAVLAPVINGGNAVRRQDNGNASAPGRGRGKDDDGSERSRSKENRKSFFSASGLGSIGRGAGRGRQSSDGGEGDGDGESTHDHGWVTSSDNASPAVHRPFGVGRRSSSSQRPVTGNSGVLSSVGAGAGAGNGGGSSLGASSRGTSLSRDGSVGSRMGGSVRKRLSLLKLGKKSSKASVRVDSVAEED